MACAAVVRVADAVAQLGGSDCEELGDGFLAQPVNAITSLAYVVAGLVVLGVAWRRGRVTVDAWVYAALLAAIGLGSVLFHGPQPAGSRVLHDLPITLTVFYMVAADVQLLRNGRPTRWSLFLPAAAVATLVTVIEVEAGMLLTGVGVLALVVCEVTIFRRDLRGLAGLRTRAAVLVISISAVAGVSFLFGRTGSPVCDPDGVVQLHAVWHVVSASVFALWWVIASYEPEDVRPVESSATPAAR